MLFSVAIPLRDTDLRLDYWMPLVQYFTDRHVKVFLAVNGPLEWSEVLKSLNKLPLLAELTYGGKEYNPYIARNYVLDKVFGSRPFAPGTHDYLVLMDADCIPEENYLEELQKLLETKPYLVAGRTKTKVPHGSLHFDLLRQANFECYDGFTPPDHTVGSNMVISAQSYQDLGQMREEVVSGGDGLYGIDAKARGKTVTPGSDLIVHKTISGMTLKGIVEKQFRRACCFPPDMIPHPDLTVQALNDVLHDLTMACAFDVQTVEAEYPKIVDRVFKLCMHLGVLTHHFDKPISLGDNHETNRFSSDKK